MEELEISRLEYESFREKFGGWAPKFKSFIEGKEMWDIMQKIKDDSSREVIVPRSSDTFRALATTSPSNLKVIFFLMDPFPRKYQKTNLLQATGIAMDCSNSPNGKLQPSLEIFYNAVSKELGKKVEYNKSLEYLHEQGVMMFNSDLTCKLNKTQSHEGLWEPFQKYFLETVLGSDTHIIYVLCGKASMKLERYINPFCRIFKLDHPSSAQYTHTDWDSDGIFLKINRILKDNNMDEVFWDRRDWEDYKIPPF